MLTELQKKVLKKLVGILNDNKISFLVSGGLAAIAYGAKRPLYDIDIDVAPNDIPRTKDLFREYVVEDFHHLQDDILDIWLMTLNIDGVTVDITQTEECYYKGKDGRKIRIDTDLSNAEIRQVEGIEVPIENKQELIRYKSIIARDTDLIDIRQIS